MQVMLQEALADIRRSVAALRSEPTLSCSLLEAIQPLIQESLAAGLVARLDVTGEPRSLPAAMEMTLYRAVQEGLTNANKHAQATQVEVCLDYLPHAIRLSIQDNGIGSKIIGGNLALPENSFGLLGLRERVQILGGELHIRTAPAQGFFLEIRLQET
jgi:signal transduction histidine kinase